MIRNLFSATVLAMAATAAATPGMSWAQGAPSTMQPGQHLRLGPVMGERVVRMVMIGDDGNSVDIVYDMAPGLPQSARVLRLENVNGMLQVIYDYSMPARPLASAGLPRLVQQGGGMYEVVYDPQ